MATVSFQRKKLNAVILQSLERSNLGVGCKPAVSLHLVISRAVVLTACLLQNHSQHAESFRNCLQRPMKSQIIEIRKNLGDLCNKEDIQPSETIF